MPHDSSQSDAWFAVDPPRSEVDVMAGRAVLNSFRSEASSAQALSLRTKITPHFAASVTYTEAQDVPLDWHSGAAMQLWAETSLTSAFSVGAGVGVFITADRSNTAAANSATDPAGILGDHDGLCDQQPLGRPGDLEQSHDPRRRRQ
jgi:hypothetical protein